MCWGSLVWRRQRPAARAESGLHRDAHPGLQTCETLALTTPAPSSGGCDTRSTTDVPLWLLRLVLRVVAQGPCRRDGIGLWG